MHNYDSNKTLKYKINEGEKLVIGVKNLEMCILLWGKFHYYL